MRWFNNNINSSDSVNIECIDQKLVGLSIAGPKLTPNRAPSTLFSVWIFQHLDPNFRGEFDLTSGLKRSNFGAKRAQLQKPAIRSKQLPKKCRKIHTVHGSPCISPCTVLASR